eukprot:291636-Prymnesium_polylepis.1
MDMVMDMAHGTRTHGHGTWTWTRTWLWTWHMDTDTWTWGHMDMDMGSHGTWGHMAHGTWHMDMGHMGPHEHAVTWVTWTWSHEGPDPMPHEAHTRSHAGCPSGSPLDALAPLVAVVVVLARGVDQLAAVDLLEQREAHVQVARAARRALVGL